MLIKEAIATIDTDFSAAIVSVNLKRSLPVNIELINSSSVVAVEVDVIAEATIVIVNQHRRVADKYIVCVNCLDSEIVGTITSSVPMQSLHGDPTVTRCG